MRKIGFLLFLFLFNVPIGEAIAQDAPVNLNTNSSALTGTTPANNSFENNGNGIQQINSGSFTGTLTTPTCTSRVCPFAIGRITPNGSELIIGIIANLGGSADEDRAAAEKLRIEMEGVKNNNDYKLQLLDKLATAIDSGNSVRIRAVAIALAPLEGYKDFREYLKALLNEKS
ncbi:MULTISPECIES: hypothetical protein [Pseudanabaena]|uniref:Uncharacterized protein n=2 Tax=Pseudanabaena TaxID=1152 RepID=L8N107_9CYAN|nr:MULTISPECIES: hypothetical protein [Pseudanabaena]ELS33401.1 hypothetical protein Pse7429DRAFT_1739 [Pseudanabaena biceps PCC 7429]MDG3494382.1 hypothetical protein [Pseudanabaena catenata USMAC16]